MFTAIIQIFDLIKLNQLGLFLPFFTLSWGLYIFKLIKAKTTKSPVVDVDIKAKDIPFSVSVIIPVVDEPSDVWTETLLNLKEALKGIKNEVLVIANGGNGVEEAQIAEDMGFKTLRLAEPGKRNAIFQGVARAKNEIVIILDSDTLVSPRSIRVLLQAFKDPKVGGATPKHIINTLRVNNSMRRISDWLEDIRFNEVLKGQNGAIGCLPGRLLAIRRSLLKKIAPLLVSQKFLGKACISGDDRFITSWLLSHNWKTVYVPQSIVYTEAPDTLKQFINQRLRWSRTSFRETILSLSWIFKYPFTALTTLSNVIFRWTFFVIVVIAILTLAGVIDRNHYFNLTPQQLILGTIGGFIVSGFLRQLRHLLKYPKDIKYFLQFLFITTFILTPVEWYGNITIKESHWMTRKLEAKH